MGLKDLKFVVRRTFNEWREDQASRLAAALAYYTIFSIPPLLVIALSIVGQIYDRQLAQQQLISQARSIVGSGGASAIETILQNAQSPTGNALVIVFGLATLLFGASGAFSQLESAMNTIWDVPPQSGQGILHTIRERLLAFAMVLSIGFLLTASLVISTMLGALDNLLAGTVPNQVVVFQLIEATISFGTTVLLFALLFKVMPEVEIAWRDIWVGATVTALLFSVGKWLLSFYVSQATPGSAYGAAGSLIVLLVWIYYSSQILFLGAEFTQVYANHYGRRLAFGHEAPGSEGEAGIEDAEEARSVDTTQDIPPVPSSVARPATDEIGADFRLQQVVNRFHHTMVAILALPAALWPHPRHQQDHSSAAK
jgi:membrane protein